MFLLVFFRSFFEDRVLPTLAQPTYTCQKVHCICVHLYSNCLWWRGQSSRAQRTLIWKIAWTCMEVANLNLECSGSFLRFLLGNHSADPKEVWQCYTGNYEGLLLHLYTATCNTTTFPSLCINSTQGHGAIKASIPKHNLRLRGQNNIFVALVKVSKLLNKKRYECTVWFGHFLMHLITALRIIVFFAIVFITQN